MRLWLGTRTLVLATGVALGVAVPTDGQPTTLFTNARVLLMDSGGRAASNVLVVGGRIAGISIGFDERRPPLQVVDLRGATLMPAFTDHHLHLLNIGLWLLNDAERERLFVELGGATSLDEVRLRVRERARVTPRGQWIVGAGWNQMAWGASAMPGATDLDGAAPEHPVFLARSDGHAGWVNEAALRQLRFPVTSTGSLLEGANEPFVAALPAVADTDVRRAYRLAADALAARGVAEVYDAGALAFPGIVALNADFGRFLRLLRAEDAAAALPVRVNLMIPAPSALAESLLVAPHRFTLSPRLRITHLKLFADGALGSRGAALTHPYADDAATSGAARLTTSEITALALRALDAGLGVATHAIGDEAVKRVLDAYEAVIATRPELKPTRLRIEHFSYAREADLVRAARMGIVLSIQSGFNSGARDDPPFGAVRVGAANEPRVYAWDRLERLGAQLAEGSDYFSRPLGPLAGFEAALTRRNAVGPARPDSVARPLALGMQVARRESDGVTPGPAVRLGASADFVVLSEDPLRVPLDSIARIRVLRTYTAGRLVYRAAPAAARRLFRTSSTETR